MDFVEGVGKILKTEKVESGTVFLNDISSSAFLVNVDYFTPTITLDEFNSTKERINLDILRLLEKMKISIAGKSTTVTVVGAVSDTTTPSAPRHDDQSCAFHSNRKFRICCRRSMTSNRSFAFLLLRRKSLAPSIVYFRCRSK